MLMAVVMCALGAVTLPEIEVGRVEKVSGGYRFTEGPVWTPQGLLFSDLGGSAIHQADGTMFRRPSGRANGLGWDQQGRLLACEHLHRQVSATNADGSITTLASHYQGRKLNSPNDLAIRSDGAIFFTDPPYGGHKKQLRFCGVYRIDTDGTLTLLSKMTAPNGIAISRDEKTLYVADSEDGHIMAFDLDTAGNVSNPRMFAVCPNPDGMKVGPHGELWVAAAGGVRIYHPDTGEQIKKIRLREHPANIAFDATGSTLYITARTSLYKCSVTWQKP